MPLVAGDQLGPYEILSPLGAGGMGEVYRARDKRLGRDVALKILPPEVANDPLRRQRVEQLARSGTAPGVSPARWTDGRAGVGRPRQGRQGPGLAHVGRAPSRPAPQW